MISQLNIMNLEEKNLLHESRSFLNNSESAVYDSLLGTASAYKNLVVLENHKIIMRRDHRQMTGRVKILAGGGAGLEPGDIGCIGPGMLTAAVLGEVLVAPPANSILIAIRELAYEHPDGILLLVKNYLGDQLNFGLALERAISEDINIKMLLIGDDCSNLEPAKYGRRGLAGCILVYKIAGAMAEAGKSLVDIFEMCREQLLTDLSTISMCLSLSSHLKWGYNMKGEAPSEDEAIIGIGLYGQPGFKVKFSEGNDIIERMIDIVTNESSKATVTAVTDGETPIVVLVNNLGAISCLEEGVICRLIITELEIRKFSIVRFYRGTFMPLLNSKGFSITLLKVTDSETLKFLDAPTLAFNWPKSAFVIPDFYLGPSSSVTPVDTRGDLPLTEQAKCNHESLDERVYADMSFGPSVSSSETFNHQLIISFAAEALISCEKRINTIDLELGDGDTGTMLKNCATAIEDALEKGQINLMYPFKMLQDLSRAFESTVGGITGALYSIFFRSASRAFLNAAEANRDAWCSALKAGMKAVQHYGRGELGDRTFLDVLFPAVEVFELANQKRDSIYRMMCNIACTCEYYAEESKKYTPVDVRGTRPKNVLVYPDAGAHAAAIWIRAVCEAFDPDIPTEDPGIFVWTFLSEEEANYILKHDTQKSAILEFLEKKLEKESPQEILLFETALYCRENYDDDAEKTSSLMSIMYQTHMYFKASRWRTPDETYAFFKESILCHSISCPPRSIEVFSPWEARDALLFFVELYMRNLPLTRLLCLPHYKLRLKIRDGEKQSDIQLKT